jgi:hypothetical protein
MGMDPLLPNETFEVTVVLEGPVRKANFRLFKAEVDKFIDACALIDHGHGGPKPKLQVRGVRGGVRKNA